MSFLYYFFLSLSALRRFNFSFDEDISLITLKDKSHIGGGARSRQSNQFCPFFLSITHTLSTDLLLSLSVLSEYNIPFSSFFTLPSY